MRGNNRVDANAAGLGAVGPGRSSRTREFERPQAASQTRNQYAVTEVFRGSDHTGRQKLAEQGPPSSELDRQSGHVLGMWFYAPPAQAHSLVTKSAAALGISASVGVYPCVVDDGIVDIVVAVNSFAEARQLRAAVRRKCRAIIGIRLVGASIFPRPSAFTHRTSPPPLGSLSIDNES